MWLTLYNKSLCAHEIWVKSENRAELISHFFLCLMLSGIFQLTVMRVFIFRIQDHPDPSDQGFLIRKKMGKPTAGSPVEIIIHSQNGNTGKNCLHERGIGTASAVSVQIYLAVYAV